MSGTLAQAPLVEDPVFGVQVPQACPNVPAQVLQPQNTWQDRQAYDEQARKLAGMFAQNFGQFAPDVSAEVRDAGPRQG